MKLSANSGNFESCPEYVGEAVCVDVTEPRTVQSDYGPREVFKLVFEVGLTRDDGSQFCVWSRPFTPSLNEKANFRKFIKQWFGADLTTEQLNDFETEKLVGRPAFLTIIQEHIDGKVFANIAACTPSKSESGMEPSGKFVRQKDRENNSGNAADTGSNYKRAAKPAEETFSPSEELFAKCKVHVGRHKGTELRDLGASQIDALTEHWLPTTKAAEKKTADDKRLIAALDWWESNKAAATAGTVDNEDTPY